MKTATGKICSLLFLLSLMVCGQSAQASTVSELLAQERLQLRSWLDPATDIVPGQQVKLILEIATDRWFAGGTRIRIPEVAGLVILQTDEFASNSSEQRNGQSWVVQRWSLEVYPQREGNFTIPAIAARIKVNGDEGQVVEGEVTSPALRFKAIRPESLARIQHWVAAPGYTVSQTFDRALEGLNVGDALEREIVFEANEVMAMMLPTFTEEPLSGLTAYNKPPVLNNRSNRGTLVATRTQHITYIVEAQGEYQLPAQDYFWWDTRTGELQLLSLPTVDIEVGAGEAANANEEITRKVDWSVLLSWAGTFLLVLGLLWLGRKIPIKRHLARVVAGIAWLRGQWRELRKPGLPERLNPGNSSAD